MSEAPMNAQAGEWTQPESPLFVNCTTYTQELLPEICRRANRPRLRILTAALVIYLLLMSVLFFGKGNVLLGWMALLLLALPLVLSRWVVRRAVKQTLARSQVLYGQPDQQILSFGTNRLTIRNPRSGGELTLPYGQIRRMDQSRHCYFFDMEGHLLVTVDKAGFQRGDPQDFLPFIQEKLAQAGRKPGASRWDKLKPMGFVVGIMLLLFSVLTLFFSAKSISAIRPSLDYTDMGVRTFVPVHVLPTPVKNTSPGRNKRTNPTKTVYIVEYVAEGGTPYRHRSQGFPARDMAQGLFDRGPIDLRVVLTPDGAGFFVTPPDQSMKAHFDQVRSIYFRRMALSGGYLLCYGATWLVIVWKRRKNTDLE